MFDIDADDFITLVLLSFQVKGYSKARFKGFKTEQEAWDFVTADRQRNAVSSTGQSTSTSLTRNTVSRDNTRTSGANENDQEKVTAARQIGTARTTRIFSEERRTTGKDGREETVTRRVKVVRVTQVNDDEGKVGQNEPAPASRRRVGVVNVSRVNQEHHDQRRAKKRRLNSSRDCETISIHINFDGGSRGNPGLAGSGAFITIKEGEPCSSKEIRVRYYMPGRATNNEAEYRGLLVGLKIALKELRQRLADVTGPLIPKIDFVVRGDSNLVIQQLNGSFACKSSKLKPLYCDAKKCLQQVERLNKEGCNLILEHVYRDVNRVADGK